MLIRLFVCKAVQNYFKSNYVFNMFFFLLKSCTSLCKYFSWNINQKKTFGNELFFLFSFSLSCMEPLEKGNPCNGNSMTKALDAMSNTRTRNLSIFLSPGKKERKRALCGISGLFEAQFGRKLWLDRTYSGIKRTFWQHPLGPTGVLSESKKRSTNLGWNKRRETSSFRQ